MATAGLKVILDDNAPAFKYSGGVWTLSTLVQWYSQTSNYPGFADNTVFGSFTVEFEGTSIAFIGNTPPNFFSESQIATVSIDGGAAYNTTYGTTPPPAYVQWYQSPTLPNGNHTITVSHLAGTAVDIALITVGPNTSLQGKTLIVDDDNSAIEYYGTWTRNTSPFNEGTLPDGFPVGNSTHRSTTVGDTITFRFTGTSVSIYGIFSWFQLGSLGATYTLDGTSIPQTYLVTTRSPQYTANDGEASNFILFSSETLAAGDHTLVINITQCVNQTFILDYITYTPSFSTLALMPNLTSTSLPTTTFNSGSSSAVPSGSPSSGLTNGSQVSQSNIGTKKTPIGAIVGGAIGGVLIVLLMGFLLGYLRRRRSSDMARPEPSGTQNGGHNSSYANSGSRTTVQVSPFGRVLGHSPTSSDTISPFPNVAPVGFASMMDLKRERLDPSNTHTTAPPFPGGIRGDSVSPNASPPSSSGPESSITSNVGNTDSLYYQDGVPPAYENISTHRHSNLPSS